MRHRPMSQQYRVEEKQEPIILSLAINPSAWKYIAIRIKMAPKARQPASCTTSSKSWVTDTIPQ